MKVALIARSNLYSAPGGDTTQVLATAKYLQRQGVEADVRLSADNIDYNQYHLLHFFNIIRPADILKHLKSGKPYVVSTIFIDYAGFDKQHRKGWQGMLFKLFSPGLIEYSKAVARHLSGRAKIISPEYLWRGHTRSVKKVIEQAACLLPNSESEYQRLKEMYQIEKKYFVVPNGIDEEIFEPLPAIEKDASMVVCAARIEGIKNQLKLIEALNNTHYKLYLIGNAAPNQRRYYEQCKKLAAPNIIFIENLPQKKLKEYLCKAKVHVLPSWFETTGLSSLEAAAMKCNIVTGNRGDAKEYFGDKAFYCDPASPASIREAVEKAATTSHNPDLEQQIRTKFTWQQAAFMTIQAYQAI
jgi:glycosyltransferase involved in cell wall biosynthesis